MSLLDGRIEVEMAREYVDDGLEKGELKGNDDSVLQLFAISVELKRYVSYSKIRYPGRPELANEKSLMNPSNSSKTGGLEHRKKHI